MIIATFSKASRIYCFCSSVSSGFTPLPPFAPLAPHDAMLLGELN